MRVQACPHIHSNICATDLRSFDQSDMPAGKCVLLICWPLSIRKMDHVPQAHRDLNQRIFVIFLILCSSRSMIVAELKYNASNTSSFYRQEMIAGLSLTDTQIQLHVLLYTPFMPGIVGPPVISRNRQRNA